MTNKSNFSLAALTQFFVDAQAKKISFFRIKENELALTKQHSIVLRHDVDICLETALNLATVEAEHGVFSTFFVLLRSPHYNALSPEGARQLRAIARLGHEVGLHWDGSQLPEAAQQATDVVNSEAKLLGSIVDEEIVSVSQHFPTTGEPLDLSRHFPHDTYSNHFRGKFKYVSDSSMAWRESDLSTVLNNSAQYQLLLHPVWWAQSGITSREKLAHTLDRQTQRKREQFQDFEDFMADCLVKRAELDASFIAKRK